MRIFAKTLILVFLSILLLSNTAFAAPSTGSNYKPGDLQQMRKIHDIVVKRGLASLNADGTIVINTNATELGVDENLFKEYLKNLDSVNFAIREGGVSFDKNFDVQVASKDQITKIIYDKESEGTSKYSC